MSGWVHDPEKILTLKAEFRRARKPKCCMIAAIQWGLQDFDLETSVRLGIAGHDLPMHGYPVPRPEGKS